ADFSISAAKDFIAVGHTHQEEKLVVVWADCKRVDNNVQVGFWVSKGNALDRFVPDDSKLSGKLMIGMTRAGDLSLAKQGDIYQGQIGPGVNASHPMLSLSMDRLVIEGCRIELCVALSQK
ncbi:MAG: hypothetical protein VYE44_04405, partial [Verrucomicrobiota bacterium]|nr:hypothetical protein [Verrucomicrobiota bacterium]